MCPGMLSMRNPENRSLSRTASLIVTILWGPGTQASVVTRSPDVKTGVPAVSRSPPLGDLHSGAQQRVSVTMGPLAGERQRGRAKMAFDE